jgi:hypothetical protein
MKKEHDPIPARDICTLCKQKYDPNCTWGPCKLTRELEKGKIKNGNSTQRSK